VKVGLSTERGLDGGGDSDSGAGRGSSMAHTDKRSSGGVGLLFGASMRAEWERGT
jgi:hypothetical protein